MQRFNIMMIIKVTLVVVIGLGLAACGAISARLAEEPVKRITAVDPTQACDANEQLDPRLAGAFLRQSSAAGATFTPTLITGRANKNGLDPDLTFNDQAQTQEVEGIPGTVYQGPRSATASARGGFGPSDMLPNVYDVSYAIDDITFSGPVVVGPGAFIYEIPSSGAALFSGRIVLELITQTDSGDSRTQRATGRFAMQAGYGSARGNLTASGFGADLPFETLSWSNLFLCGTRFVSSGKGVVTVQKEGGPALSPFKEDRAPAAFRALFESSLLAPDERPSPPVGFGGVFVIQSNNGTMTAVFLSDQVVVADPPEEDSDA